MKRYTITMSIIFILGVAWGLEFPALGLSEIFVDVTEGAGIDVTHRGSWNEYRPRDGFEDGYMAVGQAWGDYDNDGWVDLYLTGNMDSNRLYRNNGDGTFSPSVLSEQVSMPDRLSGGAVWADYDNDGWQDLFVLSHGANVLFHNEGGSALTDVTEIAGVGDPGKGTSAAWGDYDNDGYLDLFVVNWSCYPKCDPLDNAQAQDRLYHNNGDGTFSDISAALHFEKRLGAGFAASFVDFDDDGDLDIYVINDMLKNPIGNVLWRNDGSGCSPWCWTDASAETGTNVMLHGMGLATGDYDNDLDLDFYFSDMVNPMVLLQNQGNGTFEDVADDAGVNVGPSSAVGWGTGFLDYNNDGWLDIYLATTEFIQYTIDSGPEGMHFPYPNFFFHNNGDGTFSDVTPVTWVDDPRPTMGFAYADYDHDGWVDFVVGNWNEDYRLYRNQGLAGQANHWLTIKLTGGGSINRDAIGTRVYLTTSDGLTQMKEVKSGSSLGAGNDTALHFGLGAATAQQVLVRWPNGEERIFQDVPSDQIWHITNNSGQGVSPPPPDATLWFLIVIRLLSLLLPTM